jgi:hypothetical protein
VDYDERKLNHQPVSLERDKPRQGVLANMLKLFRQGAVGFIGWLDLFCKNRIIVPKRRAEANVGVDFVVHKMRLWQ